MPSTVLLRTQSDERLVALARAGHERAFEAIVERYRRPLARETRRYLPEARAEDALQQTWVAAWTALARGDDVRELRPWLYRIARNTALNQLRVSGYDYAQLREALRMGPAPQDELERRSVVRQTLAGLANLPERQRQALLYIAVEGRGQEEVARDLGISEGAVRQLVHRARVTLRAAATALVPMPLAAWAAGAAGAGPPVAAEVAAGAGTGTAALLAKAGAVAVLAGGAVAGPAVVLQQGHHARARHAASAPAPSRPVDAADVSLRPSAAPKSPAVAGTPAGRGPDRRGGTSHGRGDRRREGSRGGGEGRGDATSGRGRGSGGEDRAVPTASSRDGSGDVRTEVSRSGASGGDGSGDSRSGSSGGDGSSGSGDGSSGDGGRSGGDDAARVSPTPTAAPTIVPTATATPDGGDGGHDGSTSGSGGSGGPGPD
jgi:RNA polymerase sigma factor (sigma-70 family)